MATIRLVDTSGSDELAFTFATESFSLKSSGTFETDNPTTLSDAAEHPLLEVDTPEVVAEDAPPDPAKSDDPQVNPRIDHLTGSATPEAKAAAEANLARIHEDNLYGYVDAFNDVSRDTVKESPVPPTPPKPPTLRRALPTETKE